MDCVKEKLYQHKNLWDEGYYEEMLLTEYLQGALASLVMQESVEGVLDKKATLISSRESQHKALLETLPLCHLYAHSGVETGNNMGLTLSLSNKPEMGARLDKSILHSRDTNGSEGEETNTNAEEKVKENTSSRLENIKFNRTHWQKGLVAVGSSSSSSYYSNWLDRPSQRKDHTSGKLENNEYDGSHWQEGLVLIHRTLIPFFLLQLAGLNFQWEGSHFRQVGNKEPCGLD